MGVSSKNIVAIMVNYKTPELVVAGLSALSAERVSEPGLHVVIVDNASGDHSLEFIERFISDQQWCDWVKLVAAEKNGGYAYGNNIGFDAAVSWVNDIAYFWMLNPDTEIHSSACAAMIEFLESVPRAIAGSRLEDRDGTVQVSAFNFPSMISEMCAGFSLGLLDRVFIGSLIRRPIPKQSEPVGWLAGASLMFSADVYNELGGLDEKYFLYFEEVDYLLNARRKGIQCWYVPESRIIHEVGAATGISDARKKQPRRPAYWFESRRRYYLKNHGRFYLLAADCLWATGYALWYVRKFITDKKQLENQPPRLLSDFIIQSQLNPCKWFVKV